MYWEEAEVKKYTSISKATGKERTNFQINLKKDSQFRRPEKVGLIDVAELNKVETFLEANKVEENEVKLNELQELKLQLEQEVKEYKTTSESLASDVYKLKEEKTQLQEDLLKEKETSKRLLATITKLTNEKTEIEKENIFLKNRNWFNRLVNKQYKKTDLPEIVEAEAKNSKE